MREMVGGCCVCSDDRGWSENPLVYCDGQSCTVAVHQACYGIVTVPTGPWYCRKCESQERSVKVKCELCPSKYGALKRTDNSGWAHVVCALYIPEVRFGNVTTMEPIQLQLIPTERFNKLCYICEEKGKAANATVGACMQCNKAGCKQQFHVTCAQSLGLLCEEAGNYLDNVKYCGYCQYHYSKLRKGTNVKTIPPYKPVASTENHLSDSNSEKEIEGADKLLNQVNQQSTPQQSTSSSSSSSSKRKTSSSSTSKTSSSSSSKQSSNSKLSTSLSNSSHQKTVHNNTNSGNNSKSIDKIKINSHNNSSSSSNNNNSSVKSAKNIDETKIVVDNSLMDNKTELKSTTTTENSEKTEKSYKKRKSNSRTPTPVISEAVSVVVNTSSSLTTTNNLDNKKTITETSEKIKKAKIETTQSILTNQPIVALTSISTIKTINQSDLIDSVTVAAATTTTTTNSIIQQSGQTVNSLVVSVPLVNTSLSPHHQILNNQTSVVTSTPFLVSDKERAIPNHSIGVSVLPGGNGNQGNSIIQSEMSGGGLKITYEKQDVHTEVDMELEITPTPATTHQEINIKRSEKSEKSSRGKKRNSNSANGIISQLNNPTLTNSNNNSNSNNTTKKSSSKINLLSTSPPQTSSSGAGSSGVFSSISQLQLKDSPPSSPSSESQSALPQCSNSRGRTKSRKNASSSVISSTPGSPKETKDIKLFQNGVNAPHMLGNQLNPNSNMAQKMSDHLNSELEAHSIFNPNDNSNIVGPQLHHRVVASARASSTGSSTASGGSGLSSMLSGGNGGNIPQTLDQLLERQWEQGSQFLMEQAQHFDIASLLSCLHQLRAENLRLEEHVSSLLQRRDHLLAVNARLAIPLTGQPATPQSSHSHTVNNIHPAVGASHSDIPRSRHNSNNYVSHSQGGNAQHSNVQQPIENGFPTTDPTYSHRNPTVNQAQPSPSLRHSPAGSGYPNSALLRQNADTSGRSAPRPQPYPLYQTPSTSSQQQIVLRRDSDMHHPSFSKPS